MTDQSLVRVYSNRARRRLIELIGPTLESGSADYRGEGWQDIYAIPMDQLSDALRIKQVVEVNPRYVIGG